MAESARSIWFPSARRVEMRVEPLPNVGSGDVKVQAILSGLSGGTDMLVYRGLAPRSLDLDLPALRGSFSFPIKYGYSCVGRVMEVGPGASFSPGDLVFAYHPHQDRFVISAAYALKLPEKLAEQGVFTANLETAINVLLDAGIRIGECVVVFGQGVVGLLVAQLAKLSGATVIAVEPLANRRKLAAEVGADVVLSPSADLAEEVRRRTGGTGADLAIEASGSGDALDAAIRCVALEGKVVICSWYGSKQVSLNLGDVFHRRRVRLISSQVSNIDSELQPRWHRARRLALARDLLSELSLLPLVSHRVPFVEAAAAYELVDRHPEQTVQVVFAYEDGDV